jgi:hypothetical protein
MEESDLIILMVLQPKKTSDLGIFLDLSGLNATCVYDPFPTPFTDEVLENVGGHKAYSFIDGFSGYHQVRIAKEYQT